MKLLIRTPNAMKYIFFRDLLFNHNFLFIFTLISIYEKHAYLLLYKEIFYCAFLIYVKTLKRKQISNKKFIKIFEKL